MTKATIKDLGPDDIAGVMSIQAKCGLSIWSEEGYRDEFKRADSVAFRASIDGVLVGFIVGRTVGEEAEVHNIGVLPDRRREGVGSKLLEAFAAACKIRGVKRVWLEVRRSNETAIEFYRRLEFKPSSIRKGFYRSPDEDALVMVRDLANDGID